MRRPTIYDFARRNAHGNRTHEKGKYKKSMRKRYKIVLNVEITDPDKPFPAGGDYTHLNRIDGVVRLLTSELAWIGADKVKISLDKVIDKGVIAL